MLQLRYLLLTLTFVTPFHVLCAQQAKPRASEPVTLIVRPRVGDTLWLQVDQTIEMRTLLGMGERDEGLTSGASSDRSKVVRTPVYGPRRNSTAPRVTRMHLFAHSVVEASDLSITTLLATTDSLLMWAGAETDSAVPQIMPLPLEGRNTRVRVTPDGTMSVNDPPPGAMTLGSTLSSMPGMLPMVALSVGEKWERDIPIPSVPIGGMRADGIVRATFRLDSVTKAGKVAWVSMEGTLRRDASAHDMPVGTRSVTAGTIRGQLVIDRVRAWITDAWTTIDVESELKQGPVAAGAPMFLATRVTQRVRVR